MAWPTFIYYILAGHENPTFADPFHSHCLTGFDSPFYSVLAACWRWRDGWVAAPLTNKNLWLSAGGRFFFFFPAQRQKAVQLNSATELKTIEYVLLFSVLGLTVFEAYFTILFFFSIFLPPKHFLVWWYLQGILLLFFLSSVQNFLQVLYTPTEILFGLIVFAWVFY